MTAIEELERQLREVSEKAGPAVVAIGRRSRGSGVVIGEGRVLTNAHNLRDRTTSVTFADGRSAQATVSGVDPDGDLAVLAVDTGDVEPLAWGETSEVSAGRIVYAVARGRGGMRTTFGSVTGTEATLRGPRGRRIRGSLEHTAPLARGSSGGPVVDGNGRMVALNTHRMGEGFYSALPADEAFRARVDALVAGDAPDRRRLGLALAPAEVARRLRRSVGLPERDGLLVRGVAPGGPADRAGVREGDLLVEAGGRELGNADDLHDVLDGIAADGATVELLVVRGAEEMRITVAFDDDPPADDAPADDASD